MKRSPMPARVVPMPRTNLATVTPLHGEPAPVIPLRRGTRLRPRSAKQAAVYRDHRVPLVKELLTVWIHQAAIALAETRRIRLNGIAPCATGTPFMEESAKVLGQAFMDAYPHPLLGRMPTGEEQAWSLLLLSSPLNAAVTGAVLATDEGNVGGMITGALTAAYVQAR